jgi:hypothetical protein
VFTFSALEVHRLCGLTFELTATRAVRRLGGVAQHKPRRHDAQAACRVGSRLSEGLGSTLRWMPKVWGE